MPAQLVSLNGGPSILLDKPIILIGRHPECDIQIESRKVSRRHCCIAQVNDYLVVRDLGSTNGIRINGVRVLEGRLNAKDELTIGGACFRVSWDVLPEVPLYPEQMTGRREAIYPTARPAGAADDKLLESCDEPVPLAEPGDAPRPVPLWQSRAAPDVPSEPAREERPAPPPPAVDSAEPLIPEVLKLASSSDMDLGQNRQPK
jgi:predicted component of type VI protein secretion system